MMVSEISLKDRRRGHAGNLTVDETNTLKQFWRRVAEMFQQPGEPFSPSNTTEKSSSNSGGGFFGFGGSSTTKSEQVFFGKTSDPRWMSLPLEQAIPLIPGSMLETTFWNMVATDNPDSALLRFLRARRWDLDSAYRMLTNTLRWRLHMRVDDIVKLGEIGLRNELEKLKPGMGDSFLHQLRSGKATLGGPDKANRGVCFINVQLHRKEDQPFEVVQLCALYLMETARLFCGHPMDNACIVFNLENFTLANMDYDFVKFLITCLESYYPETLGLCIIHKAPWVFSTVWSMITPLLDPVVATKIKFTKNLDEFTQYIDIGSTPVIISGNPDCKTKDEASQIHKDPEAGSLDTVPDSPEYHAYQQEKELYLQDTLAWASNTSTSEDIEKDALARLERARIYRVKRIQAEKDLRSPTIYHVKGLIKLTENGRLLIDLGGEQWVAQDITERV